MVTGRELLQPGWKEKASQRKGNQLRMELGIEAAFVPMFQVEETSKTLKQG